MPTNNYGRSYERRPSAPRIPQETAMPVEPTAFTFTPAQFSQFLEMQVKAFREVMEPTAMPRPELVTIGETSDVKLDRRLFCGYCLGDRGPRWNPHAIYYWGYDPEKADVPKRNTVRVLHPEVPKTISYDANMAKAGLEAGTHGKQCLQCGAKLNVIAA
jgi:hypothetical protein